MSVVMDGLVKVQDDSNYCTSLMILPTELLVMILSYLSIHDIISMQFVSQRFKEISETPSLWKTFVWPDYEPPHVCSVSKALKTHGEHVRQIFFHAHVTLVNILEMIHYCPKVTHLGLPRKTHLSPDNLKEIVYTMTHLEQLDVFTSSIRCGLSHHESINNFKQLFKITTGRVKNLTLKFDWDEGENYCDYVDSFEYVVYILITLLENNHPLPSIINLLICDQGLTLRSSRYERLESCLASSYTIASLEIGFYDITRVPMDLYPSIPLRKFQFGPAAKPPFVKLSDHDILGLDKDVFFLSNYDHYDNLKASLSVSSKYYESDLVKDKHLHYISNFNSVSNVDFTGVNIYPDHLEQLAIACPNLERLNLRNAKNSLQSMQGLRAIVDTCQNLQGLNLEGIRIPVESCLLLWELLSSIKKLTHLAIDLCMLTHINNNCYNAADKDKLIGMLGNCDSLKALEVTETTFDLEVCLNVPIYDLLLGHFPSLVYIRISIKTECTKDAIINCHKLKYLYYDINFYGVRVCTLNLDLPSSSSCHLQQLFVKSHVDLSAPSVQVLSAHGGLEQVVLFVRSITTSAITTLISNSPNLILLYILTDAHECALCDDNGASVDKEDYKDTVSKKFSNHKLLTTGDFILTENSGDWLWATYFWMPSMPFQDTTNCYSFWKCTYV